MSANVAADKSATIPVGATDVMVEVSVLDDEIDETKESLNFEIKPNANYVLGSPIRIESYIDEDPRDRAMLTIAALQPVAIEGSTQNATLVVKRTKTERTGALPITITRDPRSSASANDYLLAPAQVVIPANTSEIAFDVVAVDDGVNEPDETLVLSPSAQNYSVPPAGTAGASATVTLKNSTRPQLSLSVVVGETREGNRNQPGVIRISRPNQAPLNVLKVALVTKNQNPTDAQPGSDYLALPNVVTLPANALFVDLPIFALADRVREPTEFVRVQLAAGEAYTVGANPVQSVSIVDTTVEETVGVKISASPDIAAEGGQNGMIVVTRTAATANPLVVKIAVDAKSSAKAPQDFTVQYPGSSVWEPAFRASYTILAGETSVRIPIKATEDRIYNATRNIYVNVVADDNYTRVEPSTTMVRITDNDLLRSYQPALAVSGSGCIMCHARIEGNVLSDFALNSPSFFRGSFGAADLTNTRLEWNGPYHEAQINGGVLVPAAGISTATWAATNIRAIPGQRAGIRLNNNDAYPANLRAMLETKNWYGYGWDSVTATNRFLETNVAMAQFATRGVSAFRQLEIHPPQAADISKLARELGLDASRVAYAAYDQPIAGLGVFTNGAATLRPGTQYLKNIGKFKCDGDVVVQGVLYLRDLDLETTNRGCRLYVTQSVFIDGPITSNRPDGKHNLQIASGRGIFLGLSIARLGVRTTPSTLANDLPNGQVRDRNYPANGTLPWNIFSHLPYSLDEEYEPADPLASARNDDIARDARIVGLQMRDATDPTAFTTTALPSDASWIRRAGADSQGLARTDSRLSLPFTGVLLAAPRVHSGYLGLFSGAIVARVANFTIGHFEFKFDPLFADDSVSAVLPRIPTLVEMTQ